jgi:hypothetical protein
MEINTIHNSRNEDSFDAVYYSHPVPSFDSLTFMSLVFDKIYFPGVYIPNSGVDEKETIKEIERIKNIGFSKIDDISFYNSMIFAIHNKYMEDICVFTGEFGCMGILEEGANELTQELEELLYGPPPPNFTPTPVMGFAKGLPGDEKASVNGPSWISYPANALIFATRNGLPLINDNPMMPIPSLGGLDAKSNAKILSTILAVESVKLVLPELKVMMPKDIAEFREETKDYIKPFRLSMLKLSKELNAAINSDMSIEEIQKEAKFIVDTTVYPELEELKLTLRDNTKPWFRKAIDLAKVAPELITNFSTLPPELAIARLLSKIGYALIDVGLDAESKHREITRTGLAYLLKINKI